jgi:hypothetical protein
VTLMFNDTALFYLARYAEGLDSFRRFVRSYLDNPAGVGATPLTWLTTRCTVGIN